MRSARLPRGLATNANALVSIRFVFEMPERDRRPLAERFLRAALVPRVFAAIGKQVAPGRSRMALSKGPFVEMRPTRRRSGPGSQNHNTADDLSCRRIGCETGNLTCARCRVRHTWVGAAVRRRGIATHFDAGSPKGPEASSGTPDRPQKQQVLQNRPCPHCNASRHMRPVQMEKDHHRLNRQGHSCDAMCQSAHNVRESAALPQMPAPKRSPPQGGSQLKAWTVGETGSLWTP